MTDKKAKKDPWTDPDPQPGDFDEFIEEMGPEHIEHFEPGSAKVVFIGDMDPNEWVRRKWAREGRKDPTHSTI